MNGLLRIFQCPSCSVYEKWLEEIKLENAELRAKIEILLAKTFEDKQLEREDRKELENTIFTFTRFKTNGQPSPKPEAPQASTAMRPGITWSSMRAGLEAEARKKADYYKKMETKEVSKGRLNPDAPEDLRELEKRSEQSDKPRGSQ